MDTLWNVRWMTDQAPLSGGEKAKIEKLRVYTSQHINRLSHNSWDRDSLSTNSVKSNKDPESQEDKASTGRSDDIKTVKYVSVEQKEEEEPGGDSNDKIVIVVNEDDKKEDKGDTVDPDLNVIYDDLFANGDENNDNTSNGNDTLRSEDQTEIEMQNSHRL